MTRRILACIIFTTSVLFMSHGARAGLVLASDGRTAYTIVIPDDAIPAEKIAENAVSLAASYGSRLTGDDLEKTQVIVSQYVKPDKDVYLFSTTGSWLVQFWKDDESIACLYVDAHTGIPNFFCLFQDGIQYIGEPGVEGRSD